MVPSLSQSRGWGPLQISIFSEGQEKQKNPAEFLSRILWNWLVDNVIDMLLTHRGVESTTSNTGWKKSNIVCQEKLTSKMFHCLVCLLHNTEPGYRKLIKDLYGKRSSKTGS